MKSFIHLHNHTEYSLLDGFCRIDKMIEKAIENNMKAIAITDHGNMFGVIDFYLKCKKNNIKPIIGSEFYISNQNISIKDKNNKNHHLILLAKNEIGYKNLIKLSSISYVEGFYRKPRIDKTILAKHSEGLICLTSCLQGEIPYLLLSENKEQLNNSMDFFIELFGKEDFYIELQNHNLPEELEVLPKLIALSKKYNLKLVATNDCHYINKHDAEIHDILLCIQTGAKINDEKRFKFSTNEIYFKTYDEMYDVFSETPEALSNTLEIAEKCNLFLNINAKKKTYHFPIFELPDNIETPEEYISKLCNENIKNKITNINNEIKDRLKYELDIINQKGFASYFLIVRDFINYAKKNNIPVGPGRGSAAGSLVSYLIGITEINPLDYNLLFDRFLNKERTSMPDIDIDFCYKNRNKIIDYVKEKYNSKNVAQIITFGTLQTKNALRDVGRVLEFPYNEVNKILKLLPDKDNLSILEKINNVPQLKKLYKSDPLHKKWFETSNELVGMPRNTGTHAAGIVISDKPLTTYVPLFYDNRNNVVSTQFSMETVEKIGLIKMDFLGLKTLTIIDETLKLINKNIDWQQLNFKDKKTYNLIKSGKTIGVFQLESKGIINVIKKLKPDSFTDLIALLAIYRPGVLKSGMVDTFIKRKHNLEETSYLHPKLKKILKETYGIMIYQEQVMQIANIIAGYSLSQADLLRRAMGKKKKEIMDAERQPFIDGAIKFSKIPQKIAEEIFDLMGKFAEYGFNKSHSAAYAAITYRTAYLKAHYPLEFMIALLNNETSTNNDKTSIFLNEAKKSEIKVFPPDINKSDVYFIKEKDGIRYGLSSIKNVGSESISEVIEERKTNGEFKDLYDFCDRTNLRKINKAVLEGLILTGAFDFTNRTRKSMFLSINKLLDSIHKKHSDEEKGLVSLFDMLDDESSNDFNYIESEEFDYFEKLAHERNCLGLYFSDHPLNKYINEINLIANYDLEDISTLEDQAKICLAGIILEIKRKTDRNNKIMISFMLETFSGSIECIVFSSIYEKYEAFFKENNMIYLIGTLDTQYNTKILCNKIEPISTGLDLLAQNIKITLDYKILNKELLEKIKNIIISHKGETELHLLIKTPNNKLIDVVPDKNFYVNLTQNLINDLKILTGEHSIKINI